MALFDKIKDSIVDGAKEALDGLSKKEETKETTVAVKEEHQIETLEELQEALAPFESEMSPAMLQVLRSQMQVLGTISSPTMTGMMIDNLVQGLEISLKGGDETVAPSIRESYIRLIQNYVFMAEAKMHYIVDQKKEEATRLLTESGKMLTDTFMDVAMIAIPGGKAGKILRKVNKGLFLIKPSSNGDIFSNMAKFFNAKTIIEEKQKEFYATIENLFDTFSKYPGLFGKSIIINGMLAKYRKVLVERFSTEKMKVIKNRMSVAELQKAQSLSDQMVKSLSSLNLINMVSNGVQSVLNAIVARKSAQYDLQTFFLIHDACEAEIAELKVIQENEEARLKQLQEDHKKIGFFKFSEKKESTASIEEQMKNLMESKKEVQRAEKKLKELKELFPEMKALKEEINRYDARLKAVEELYL